MHYMDICEYMFGAVAAKQQELKAKGLAEDFQTPFLLSPLCNCILKADVVTQQVNILHGALQILHKVGGELILDALKPLNKNIQIVPMSTNCTATRMSSAAFQRCGGDLWVHLVTGRTTHLTHNPLRPCPKRR